MTVDAESLLKWSTVCNRILPGWVFRSIATVSRNAFDIGGLTTGLGGGFLYILYVGHDLETFLLLLSDLCC